MLKSFLIGALLVLGQKPEAPKEPQFGIILGGVLPPENTTIQGPLQVILMSEQYAKLWNQKLQEQLDLYWERYKPAFVQKKELFFEVSRMAYQDSMQFVLSRMSRDLGANLRNYRIETSVDGKFQFKSVPLGRYNLVAYGRAGDQMYYWQEEIEVTNSVPQFLQLKKRAP